VGDYNTALAAIHGGSHDPRSMWGLLRAGGMNIWQPRNHLWYWCGTSVLHV